MTGAFLGCPYTRTKLFEDGITRLNTRLLIRSVFRYALQFIKDELRA